MIRLVSYQYLNFEAPLSRRHSTKPQLPFDLLSIDDGYWDDMYYGTFNHCSILYDLSSI